MAAIVSAVSAAVGTVVKYGDEICNVAKDTASACAKSISDNFFNTQLSLAVLPDEALDSIAPEAERFLDSHEKVQSILSQCMNQIDKIAEEMKKRLQAKKGSLSPEQLEKFKSMLNQVVSRAQSADLQFGNVVKNILRKVHTWMSNRIRSRAQAVCGPNGCGGKVPQSAASTMVVGEVYDGDDSDDSDDSDDECVGEDCYVEEDDASLGLGDNATATTTTSFAMIPPASGGNRVMKSGKRVKSKASGYTKAGGFNKDQLRSKVKSKMSNASKTAYRV